MKQASVPAQRISPSSLTQRGAQPTGECPACGSTRFTSLAMTLTDGTIADFLSCHTCEHKSWSSEGVVMDFADVLRRTTKVKQS